RASRFSATPVTTWFAPKETQATACTSARAPPTRAANRTASHRFPVRWLPTTAPNAPPSIIPSSAMLNTPERSEKTPPTAANPSGVAIRTVAARKSIRTWKLRKLDIRRLDGARRCWTRLPAAEEASGGLPVVEYEPEGQEEDRQALDDDDDG